MTSEDALFNASHASNVSQYSNFLNTPVEYNLASNQSPGPITNQDSKPTNPLFQSYLNQAKDTLKSSAHHGNIDFKKEYEKFLIKVEEQEKLLVNLSKKINLIKLEYRLNFQKRGMNFI